MPLGNVVSLISTATGSGFLANPYPKPFLKWVGGKRQIIEAISANLPKNFDRYFEPFLGGGAVFFKAIPFYKESYLSDVNSNLIGAYLDIRDDLNNVINNYLELVATFSRLRSEQTRRKYFLEVRKEYNSLRSKKKFFRPNSNIDFFK
jgi:DNA adenine methylase